MSSKKSGGKVKKLTEKPYKPRKRSKKPKFSARPYKPKAPKKRSPDDILKDARAERAALLRSGGTKTKSSGREAVPHRKKKPKMSDHTSLNRDPAGYYSMLEVAPDATFEEILRSYQRVVSVARLNGLAFVENLAQQAFDTLTNEKNRRAYDPQYGIAGEKPRNPSTSIGRTYTGFMGSIADFSGGPKPEPKSWWERLLD